MIENFERLTEMILLLFPFVRKNKNEGMINWLVNARNDGGLELSETSCEQTDKVIVNWLTIKDCNR